MEFKSSISCTDGVAGGKRREPTRRLSDANRPPGNPCVKSTGYVPALATIASRDAIHPVTLTFPHDFALPPSVGRLFPLRTPPDALSSTTGRLNEAESCASVYLMESSTMTGVTDANAVADPTCVHAAASPCRTVLHIVPSHAPPAPAPIQTP